MVTDRTKITIINTVACGISTGPGSFSKVNWNCVSSKIVAFLLHTYIIYITVCLSKNKKEIN